MKDYFKIYLFTAFSIGVAIGCMLFAFTQPAGCDHTGWIKPVAVQKQLMKLELQYESKVQLLKKQNDSLSQVISSKKTALKKSSDKVLVLQSQVKDLMKDYAAIDSAATETVDSAALIGNCQEMQTKVSDLIEESNVKDSIAFSVINTLEDEIKNKDSTIDLHKTQYQLTKSKLSDVLNSNSVLSDENKLLRKQLKKKRFGNFMLKAGMVILSGITLKSIVH